MLIHGLHIISALKFPLLKALKGPGRLRRIFGTCSSEDGLLQRKSR